MKLKFYFPKQGQLPLQSLAALLVGQVDGRAAMDVALESGDVQAVVELGKLGCRANEDGQARTMTDAAILDRMLYGGMPQWLARTVGNLSYAGRHADDCGTVLQDAEEIRGRVLKDVEKVQRATGTSTAVAEALLRHFGHSPEAAIGQYQVDAKAAKAAAGIREGPASSELVCGICFTGARAEFLGGPLGDLTSSLSGLRRVIFRNFFQRVLRAIQGIFEWVTRFGRSSESDSILPFLCRACL